MLSLKIDRGSRREVFLGKTTAYLGNVGRDLAVEIGATAINRQTGCERSVLSQNPQVESQNPPLKCRSVSRSLILPGKSQNHSRLTSLAVSWDRL